LLFRIWAVLLANIGGIYPFVVIPLNQGPVEFPGLARYFLLMTTTHYLAANVDGLNISYRQAGRTEAPTLLLLHGFPSAGHMFRDLIPLLADRYHLVAPDLPGFGQSEMPAVMSSTTRLTISRSSRAVPAPKGPRRKFEISEMSAFKTLRKK
jgi:hypothetical protein